jgi:mannose-6-phosphate isomerase-like protein (cupin superfamily)
MLATASLPCSLTPYSRVGLIEVVTCPLTGAGRKGALVSGEGAKIPTAYVPAGGDRFRRQREIQFTRSVTDIKVSTLDTDGGLSVAEITYVHKGGPPRHLHHEQDEWFYVVESEYVIEVGEERYELGPGDSVLAPRKVAHVWAHVGEETGRLIAALQPAGEIEAFFDELATLDSNPEREVLRRAFSSHAMELIGPPLSIA